MGGYFYEIDDDLIKDERIEWLAELGGGKGKVSRSYVMRGIAELIKTQNTLDFLVKNKITPQQIQQVLERFTSKKTTNSLIISALQNK